ncbi:MAG TPA: hypothetical protein VGP92_00555 [Acidimicrobiia bacterium]|jgi:hypothetical protein|nr:hypothetical protein [Acidimicrobiia bacterium]
MLESDARLAAAAATQHGQFTRVQARSAGFSAAQIDRRLRAAVWKRVLPSVYRHAAVPESGAARNWAAVLWAGPGCAVSHATAATIWGIVGRAGARPELIVPQARGLRAAGIVVHRVAGIGDEDVVRVRGLPITSPVRTIIDLAGVLDEAHLGVALAAARARRLVTVRAVRVRLDEIGSVGRPGSARLRTLLAAVGSGWVDPSARMAG